MVSGLLSTSWVCILYRNIEYVREEEKKKNGRRAVSVRNAGGRLARNARHRSAFASNPLAAHARPVMCKYNALKKKLREWVASFEKNFPTAYFVISAANAIFNLNLYYLDIVTDAILLATFVNEGWVMYSAWSATFIALPYLIASYGIFKVRKSAFKDYIRWEGGTDSGKIAIFYLCCPALPIVFDILMPFNRLFGDCAGESLSNFMSQYEVTRTLSEAVLESVPQLAMQIYTVVHCSEGTCNFRIDEGGNTAFFWAVISSIACIVYRVVLTVFEMHRENLTLNQYLRQLVRMGGGLPLTKIANNEIDRLEIDFDLRASKAKLLANVLENNSSLKQVVLSWGRLDEESKQVLLDARSSLFFGCRAVCMSEEGRVKDLKSLVQQHDVEGTQESLRDLMNKEGMDSNRKVFTPLQVASELEHLEIVQYLLDECNADVSFTCDKGRNCLHRAAWYTENNLDTIMVLLNHRETVEEVVNCVDHYKETPLDVAYKYNTSDLQEKLVSLLRQHGAKANFFDRDGNLVGEGMGDLAEDFLQDTEE